MTQATSIGSLRELDGVLAPVAGTWKLDPGHTAVGFVARHMMVTKVRGNFKRFDGEIVVADRVEDSRVNVTIDADSITTHSDQRDAHLRSGDFLEIETYPTLTFRSTSVEREGDTSLKVVGDLTIKNVTRPVVLDVEYEGAQQTPWGATVAGFTARTEIDREDFGITWNQVLETGGVLVGRKIVIEIEAQATPAA
jgi:polyisoprenoid-binding protein YceI